MAKNKKTQTPFKIVISELLDASKPFSPTNLHRFSDIDPADLAALRINWSKVDTERRVHLLEDLEDLVDTDTLVSFDDLARFAMEDPEARVRAVAIRLLWETNDLNLIPTFATMMKNDTDEMVRAGAAGALGLFVFLGELEEIEKIHYQTVYDALLAVFRGQDKPVVRRRALEALGYSSKDEVPAIIEESYASRDRDWQASALFAMGRSADERWAGHILAKLDSSDDDVQLEAVRAAGELELDKACKPIMDLLKNPSEVDFELKSAAVWSLSQIGGKGVREKLERMSENAEDEDESFFIDEALDNLDFKEGTGALGIMNVTPLIDEDHTHIVDLARENDDEDEDLEFGIAENLEDEEEEGDDNPLYGSKN